MPEAHQDRTRRQAAERRAEILRLRIAGHSNSQIAHQLGISDGRASQLYHEALDRTVTEPAAEARKLELERLDDLITHARAVLERTHYVVQGGEVILHNGVELVDDGPTLAALDRLIKLSETRRRLLGLDAPTRHQHELTGLEEVDAEIRELRAERERRVQLRLLHGTATGTDGDPGGPVGDPY